MYEASKYVSPVNARAFLHPAGVRDDKLVPLGVGGERGADHLPDQPERSVQFVGDVVPRDAPRHRRLLLRDAHARPQLLRWVLPGRGRQ